MLLHPPQVWATWLMREDQGGAQAVPCGTQVQILVESLSSRDCSPKLPSHLVYYFLAHVNFHFMDEETEAPRGQKIVAQGWHLVSEFTVSPRSQSPL